MLRTLPEESTAAATPNELGANDDPTAIAAENSADAVGRGAETVGNTIQKGATAVDQTIDSTTELLSNEATPEETRVKLDAMADQILNQLLAENPEASSLYEIAAGYAVFDSRKVTVFPVSAGYGRGVAVSKVTGQHTYMNMGSGGVGAAVGIGGFESSVTFCACIPARVPASRGHDRHSFYLRPRLFGQSTVTPPCTAGLADDRNFARHRPS